MSKSRSLDFWKKFRSNNAEFTIIHGRRRISKAFLIVELIREYGRIYLLARETGDLENLKYSSEKLQITLMMIFSKKFFSELGCLFEYLHQK